MQTSFLRCWLLSLNRSLKHHIAEAILWNDHFQWHKHTIFFFSFHKSPAQKFRLGIETTDCRTTASFVHHHIIDATRQVLCSRVPIIMSLMVLTFWKLKKRRNIYSATFSYNVTFTIPTQVRSRKPVWVFFVASCYNRANDNFFFFANLALFFRLL